MAHLVLSRKYRPQRFEDLVGQEHVAQTLSNAITSGRIGHAYLFVGPRGTGKTTTARIFAKALNCERGPTPTPCGTCDSCVAVTSGNDLDVVEMDAASNNGVDDVRALRDSVGYRPARSRFRVWIVDEVHMLSLPAFNAFLKTLEEPPPQAKFLFCTTEAHKLPETFTSRVQRLEFRRIDEAKMAERLRALAERERLVVEPGVCDRIASGALGGLRDAESLLEQLLSAAQDGRVTLADLDAVTGRAPADRVAAVFDAALAGDAGAALDAAGACLDGGGKPDTVLEQWIEALRGLLVRAARARGAARGAADARPAAEPAAKPDPLAEVATRMGLPRIARSIDLLLEKRRFLREGADGRLVVEVAAVELARLPSARDLDALVDALRSGAAVAGGGAGAPSGGAGAPSGGAAVGPAATGGPVPAPRVSFERTGGGAAPPPPRTAPSSGARPSGAVAMPAAPVAMPAAPVAMPAAPGAGAAGAALGGGAAGLASPASGPLPTFDDVVARWADFLAAAGRDRRLSSALMKARPVTVEGDALVLMLPAGETYGRNTLRDRTGLEGFRVASIATWGAALRPAIVDEAEAAARGGAAPPSPAGPAKPPAAGAPAPTGAGAPSAGTSGGGASGGHASGGQASGGHVSGGQASGGHVSGGQASGPAAAPSIAADDVRRHPAVATVLDALGGRLVAVERVEPREDGPAPSVEPKETPRAESV